MCSGVRRSPGIGRTDLRLHKRQVSSVEGKATDAEIPLITAVHFGRGRAVGAERACSDQQRHQVLCLPWGMRAGRELVAVEVDQLVAPLLARAGDDTCQPVVEGHRPRGGLVFDPVRALEALVERRLAAADDLARVSV